MAYRHKARPVAAMRNDGTVGQFEIIEWFVRATDPTCRIEMTKGRSNTLLLTEYEGTTEVPIDHYIVWDTLTRVFTILNKTDFFEIYEEV